MKRIDMNILMGMIIVVLLIAVLWRNGLLEAASVSGGGGDRRIAPGDVVTCQVTLTDRNGALIYTTDAQAAKPEGAGRSASYHEPPCFVPLTVIAGGDAPVPGLKGALAGMLTGETRRISLPPEESFGAGDKALRQTFARVKTEKRQVAMTAREYVARFDAIPQVGDIVQLNPYFPARVTAIAPQQVELENLAKDVERIDGPFGFTSIEVTGEDIRIILTPTLGAVFTMDDRKGVIAASDAETFTVDFNHPLAGQTVNLTVTILKVVPQAAAQKQDIAWITNHAQALESSRINGKPCVLVLYAPWCQFSQRYRQETLSDVRIRALSKDFIWSQIVCDQNEALKQHYRLERYPLTVIMDAQGKELDRVSGFMDAGRFRSRLDCLLAGKSISEERGSPNAATEAQAGHCDSDSASH